MKIYKYEITVALNRRTYHLNLIPSANGDGKCDIELLDVGSISGDEFCALKSYLKKEGFLDEAHKQMEYLK